MKVYTKAETVTDQTQTFLKVQVRLHGVKKRCRKVNMEFINIGYIDFRENVNNNEMDFLNNLANTKVNEVMKSIREERDTILNFTKVLIKREGYFVSEQSELFSDDNFEKPVLLKIA
jgi:hypothetical protein